MLTKKLSNSFAGSATRGMSGFDKEVEARMSKGVFMDDFSPPGTSEAFPGGNFSKRNAPFEKPHDDFTPESDEQFWNKKKLHSSGDPQDQEKMDWLDEQAYKIDAPIKNEDDQFPGAVDMEDHKEIAGFDKHQTDPARLRKMADQKLSGPESFNKEVEKRMKRLMSEVKEDPKPTEEPKWNSGKNPDQQMNKKK